MADEPEKETRLTEEQLMALWQVKRHVIRRERRCGRLGYVKIAGQVRFTKQHIDDYEAQRTCHPRSKEPCADKKKADKKKSDITQSGSSGSTSRKDDTRVSESVGSTNQNDRQMALAVTQQTLLSRKQKSTNTI